MDDQDIKEFKQQFEKLSENQKETYEKLIEWAEKFGKLGESTKNQLQQITQKFDKPFYKTSEFYKAIIICLGIVIATYIAIHSKSCINLSFGEYGMKVGCK